MRNCVFIFCNYNTGHRNPIKTIRYAIHQPELAAMRKESDKKMAKMSASAGS
jgi:hypothetical protein